MSQQTGKDLAVPSDRSAGPTAEPATWPHDTGPVAEPDGAAQVTAALPEMLLSALERRYLTRFDPTLWRIEPPAEADERPQLREVEAVGRAVAGDNPHHAAAGTLTALHAAGQAVTTAFFSGDGIRHHALVGGRRVGGSAAGSTAEFLQTQAAVLQAHVPGLRLGPLRRLDARSMPELAGFLQTAPVLGVITGIPNPVLPVEPSGPERRPGLELLARAAGSQPYSLVVVAEPLPERHLDEALDRCRRLRSAAHSLVKSTLTHNEGAATAESVPRYEPASRRGTGLVDQIPWAPTIIRGLALFCALGGALDRALDERRSSLSRLAGFGQPLQLSESLLRSVIGLGEPVASGQTTTTRNSGKSFAREQLDASAEASERLLEQQIDRLESARSQGWWRTSVYVAAASEACLEAVTGALRSICGGGTAPAEPIRVVRPPTWLVREAMTDGSELGLLPAGGGASHPLGPAYDSLATCLTSRELAVLTALPGTPVPGIQTRDWADFAVSVPPAQADSVPLGELRDSRGHDLGPVTLTPQALNRHVFITGMTGYGKTTTAKQLLLATATRLDLPFLVIEPVKAEYRQLAAHPELQGRLRVYSVGADGTHPLRLNPFMPVAGVSLLRHIDLLKGVFNASFPMYAGMPYVLEEAMLEAYEERGWDLGSSRNVSVAGSMAGPDLAVVVPSLGDLHDKIEEVLSRRQYAREVHQNMGAALRSRLRSLMVGAKGAALDTHRSIMPGHLFDAPCVIELRNLGDDDDKSFVMALLLSLLYEYAESRPATLTKPHGLRHLTLIEEAHRLLRAPRADGGLESSDPQRKAVGMFTDLLAEMRAYGEGFVVADQVPSKLAPEILKNSNVKIVHRLSAPDDRSLLAASMNLTETQARYLLSLAPGEAVVHDDRIASAVLVAVPEPVPAGALPGSHPPVAAPARPQPLDLTYLHRNGACHNCPAPCELLAPATHRTSPEETDRLLWPVFDTMLAGSLDGAWTGWDAWRASWCAAAETGWTGSGRQPEASDALKAAYCTASQSGHRWLTHIVQARALANLSPPIPAGAGLPVPRPADRLACDRAARHLARLVAIWVDEPAAASGSPAAEAFTAVRGDVVSLIGTHPPRERAGCIRCPARCTALPALAPLLSHDTLNMAAHRTTAAVPAQTRARQVRELVRTVSVPGGSRLGPTPGERDRQEVAAAYCLVTLAGDIGGAEDAEEVLAVLRAGALASEELGQEG